MFAFSPQSSAKPRRERPSPELIPTPSAFLKGLRPGWKRRYGAALAAVVVAAGLNAATLSVLGPSAPFFYYFPAVIFASMWGDWGPGLSATSLSALLILYFNVEPSARLKVPAFIDAVRLAAFLCAGGVIALFSRLMRRSAERIALAETRYHSLVDGITDYAIFMLDPDGVIVSWNAGAQAIKGYTAAEIIGRHFSAFYPPEDAAKPQRELREAAAKGRFEDEGWRVRKDGSRFWANVIINAIRDGDGRLIGYSKVTRDLSERRAAEQALRVKDAELRRHTAELERAVVDLESFSYTVSHDLRAPLRAVQGYAYLVGARSGERLDEESRRLLDRLSDSAQRMQRLIRDLLVYSRVSRGPSELTPIDLDELLADVLNDRQVREKTRVEVEKPLGRVLGERSLLTQSVSNLLENALKFQAPGRAPEIKVWSSDAGGMLRLIVEDNGIGIEPEHFDRIFKVFERLHPADAYAGTGIGLAIVKKAAERMSGKVGVESQVGRGSRFWIELKEAPDAP